VSRERSGLAAGTIAYVFWGLVVLYWPLVEPAAAVEILAHRIAWSLVLVVVVLAVGRRLASLVALDRRQAGLLTLAAVLIALNWGIYIHAVNSEQVVEASLGYFINPLITVALGVLVLGERLRREQRLALGLATVAVLVLTADYGRPPWIALALALSFALYGFLKKRAGVDAFESLGFETLVLIVPAVLYLVWLGSTGAGTLTSEGPGHAVLLVGAGVVSALPLLLFGAAAVRIPLTTLGLLQYLAPTIQFFCGVVVLGEAMPAARLAGFALVWLALLVFTLDSLRAVRARRLVAAGT